MMEEDILIERYLKGMLSDQEKTAFLKRLDTDTSFKEQVTLEEQLLNVLGESYWSFAHNNTHEKVEAYKKMLESNEAAVLKTTISNVSDSYHQKQSKSKNTYIKMVVRIAAVLIIFFSILWLYNNDKIDYKAISNAAWNKNVGLDFTLRNNTTDSTKITLNSALSFYKSKNYKQVIMSLKKYNITSSHYKEVLVLRALSYHKLHKTAIAFKTLDSLATYAPNISKWYKGLIHLERNELDKAALYLEIPTRSNQEVKLKK